MGQLDKNTIKDVLRNSTQLLGKYHTKNIGLFGSFARGNYTEKSDVDILIEFTESPDLFDFVRLNRELATLLNRKVDLVTAEALHPFLKDTILSEVEWIERH